VVTNVQDSDKPLTERPTQILKFLRDYVAERGYSPTIREICRHVGAASTTSVQRHLNTLAQRGYIARDSKTSRSIQLVGATVGLPLVGRIAAGQPLQAVETSDHLDLGKLFDSRQHFVLEVKGDSMIDDHITDGDLVVIRKQETCQDGEIVAALLENGEATLKRCYRERGRFRLQPANSRLKPIYTKQVQVLGVLAGVIRKTR
jgi:repressor LexA